MGVRGWCFPCFSPLCGSCFNISQSFQGFRNRTEIPVDAQSTLLMHSGEILAGFLCWLWGGRAGRLGSFSGSFPIPSLGHYCLYWFPLAACFGEIILTAVFTSGTRIRKQEKWFFSSRRWTDGSSWRSLETRRRCFPKGCYDNDDLHCVCTTKHVC